MSINLPPAGDKEAQKNFQEGVRALFEQCGENPDREGLVETPARFFKAYKEMTDGYRCEPKDFLKKQFNIKDADAEVTYDSFIISSPIHFVSLCEHHMLPFEGECVIGYLPDASDPKSKIVGLSKLARMTLGYAHRFQVQERLTAQIANAVQEVLQPLATAVLVKSRHTCQCYRGVKVDGRMITAAMKGLALTDPSVKAEFYNMVNYGSK